jgi:hypothetical protein
MYYGWQDDAYGLPLGGHLNATVEKVNPPRDPPFWRLFPKDFPQWRVTRLR